MWPISCAMILSMYQFAPGSGPTTAEPPLSSVQRLDSNDAPAGQGPPAWLNTCARSKLSPPNTELATPVLADTRSTIVVDEYGSVVESGKAMMPTTSSRTAASRSKIASIRSIEASISPVAGPTPPSTLVYSPVPRSAKRIVFRTSPEACEWSPEVGLLDPSTRQSKGPSAASRDQ